MAVRENLEFGRQGPDLTAEKTARLSAAGRQVQDLPIKDRQPAKNEIFVFRPSPTSTGLSWSASKIRAWIQ